jgi:hypothetical protein
MSNSEHPGSPQNIAWLPATLPPDNAFVTLSHAVSWIAFQHSVDGPHLSDALGIGEHRDPLDADEDAKNDNAIEDAIMRLTDRGSVGAIEIRGRHFRDVLHNEYEIFTIRIDPVRLADFRWFDSLDDSLHRGLGLAWDRSRRQLCYPGDDRHFRFVTVNRAELLQEFPPKANFVAQSTGAAEKECRTWLLAEFSKDEGNRKSKRSFRAAALHKFGKNLSARGFDRAWARVAESAGRNRAGAKSKQ